MTEYRIPRQKIPKLRHFCTKCWRMFKAPTRTLIVYTNRKIRVQVCGKCYKKILEIGISG